MEFWLILFVSYVGLVVFCKALKHDWEQWYYGRLNRKTFEEWRRSSRH